MADWLLVTAVTGYFDLEEFSASSFGNDSSGFGCSWTKNTTESFTQELRLESDIGGRVLY